MAKKNIKYKGVICSCCLVIVGVLVNWIGARLARTYQLPLFLDAIGTSVAACFLGPLWGALCGALSNAITGLSDPVSLAYVSASVAIGLIVGYAAKKGLMNDLFRAMSVAVVVALFSVFVSVPLNCIFYDGYSNNVWADAARDMMLHFKFHSIIASVIGEFFVDFPDKVLTLLITYGIVRIPFLKKHCKLVSNHSELKEPNDSKSKIKKMKSSLIYIAVIGSLLAFGVTVQAEKTKTEVDYSALYTPTIYNSENGLTGGAANDIAETEDGYIWIGTYAGLYRYDGIDFTMMDELDSVKNVNCLYVDEEGRLWIGTNDNGLTVYVKDRDNDVVSMDDGLPSNSVRCIKADSFGNYYVGTSDALCVLTMENGIQVQKVISQIGYVNYISVSDDGLAAVVNNSGDLYLMRDGAILKHYAFEQSDAYFTSCEFMQSGELLVGTSDNIIDSYLVKDDAITLNEQMETGDLRNINAMKEDESGNTWICSDNGIGYFDEEGSFRPFNISKFNSSIDNIAIDYHGNLWFTSSRLGLLKLCESGFVDVYSQNGLAESVVNSVTKWNGDYYFGTDSGLSIVNLENNQVITNALTKRLSGQRIRCLNVDSQNHLWICTSDGEGLFEIDSDENIKIYDTRQGTVGNRFRAILELSDQTMAVAENTGLDFIKDGKVIGNIEERDGLSIPQILSLLELPDQTLLAGTDGDGIAVIKDRKLVGKIGVEDGLTSGVILRMVSTQDGIIAVTSNSLCYIDSDWNVTELDNFPYSNNYDMIPTDNGKYWILSSAGIYIADEEDLVQNKEVVYELLDSKKGLKSPLTVNAWNYVDENGNLFLSCNTGAYMVNMDNYDLYSHSYRMLVEYMKADDELYSLSQSGKTEISKNVKRIVIKPVVLNYSLNDPYVSYYLEGFDKKPTVVKQSSLGEIVYTNLPSGEYTFHLSILDNTEESTIESCSYVFEKKKQFWEHGWFKAYFIFVYILAVAYLTRLITKLQSNRIIERQNQEITLAKKQLQMGNETILAIAKTVDAKDENTSQHSSRVAEYSVLIARRLGWSDEKCENLRKIALLHDIGKIGIPDSVLNKPGRLTDEEYEVMKSHVLIGSRILKDFTIVDNVIEGALYHHERYDGKGYIHGLKGEEIPENARIIAIADAFDAMTSNRVYRKHMDMDYVMEELRKGCGTQFDPEFTKILIALIDEGVIDVEKRRGEEGEY